MPRNPKIRRVSNIGLYEKIEGEKNRSLKIFVLSILFSLGLVTLFLGIQLFIDLISEFGADMWVTCVGYIIAGFALIFLSLRLFDEWFYKGKK